MLGLRRVFWILSAGWLLFLLAPLSSTGLAFPSFCLVFGITILFGAIGLGLVLLRRPVNRLSIVAWLGYPLAACSLLLLFLFSQSPANPLFRLRFDLSRPALENAARTTLAKKPLALPVWAGLFPLHRVDDYDSEIRFMSGGCGVVDECGFLYSPQPLPGGRSKTRVKHIDGPWYQLYAVF